MKWTSFVLYHFKWLQIIMKGKKYACLNIEKTCQKCFIKKHNLCDDENTFSTTFIFICVPNTFSLGHYQTHNMLSHFLPFWKFMWWWFIKIGLCKTTLGSISCMSSFGQFQYRIYETFYQPKKHGKVPFWMCVFLDFVFPTPFSWFFFQYLFSQYACISFLFNWFQCNWIKKKIWTEFQISSNCMQCNSIFSLKWNLIFTMYFNFLIHWSLLLMHNNVKPEIYIYPYLVETKISQNTIVLRPFLITNQIWIGYYT
jgi:hypothetical protein